MGENNLKNIDNKTLFTEVLRRYKCLLRPFGSVIVLGSAGSGKTTHSTEISELNCWCLVDPVSILNQLPKTDTDQDEALVNAVFDRIKQPICAHGAVFDGFPQNLNQALKFERRLKKDEVKIDRVLEMKNSEKRGEYREVMEYYKEQGKVMSFDTSCEKKLIASQLRSIFSKGVYGNLNN